MDALRLLIQTLSKLPGVGRKSAARMAYYLLKADNKYVSDLGKYIYHLKDRIITCSLCGNYTEQDPCPICTDPKRDQSCICIVEQSQDVLNLEESGEFRGLYHVLQGVISPLDGYHPEDLTIPLLEKRISSGTVSELIIATNPTVEGDTTALYLAEKFKKSGLKVSRLASGLPVGGDIEYADKRTIALALRGRTQL
ncbi:MAG: recombination protein RecR [Spirochaetales bacterium]|nr:recombination protein RecR [Spirochaetales bacterium]